MRLVQEVQYERGIALGRAPGARCRLGSSGPTSEMPPSDVLHGRTVEGDGWRLAWMW